MIITIHQPEHMPYWGFLDKINKSDKFVILDDVQFKKNNYQNRNRILTQGKIKWLSIPVKIKGRFGVLINECEASSDWKDNYKNQLFGAYSKHPFFQENIVWIEEMLAINSERLVDYNNFIIRHLLNKLEVKTDIIFSSGLNIKTSSSDRLLDICQVLNGDSYLAGKGAIDYLDKSIFEDKIELISHNFEHPVYPQKYSSEFERNLSILDMLMNIGFEKTKEFLHLKK